MSESKRTFGLLAAVVLAGTLFFGVSIGVMVAEPKAAEAAPSTDAATVASSDLDRRWRDDLVRGDVDTLVEYYSSWNDLCRGFGMGSELTCEKREIVSEVLGTKGMCNGKVGQAGYQRSWHVCVANSCRPGEPC